MSGWWLVSYVVLWALVVVLGVMVVALARQIGTLHLRLGPRGALEMDDEGPPLGEAPPVTEVTTIDGEAITVGGPGPDRKSTRLNSSHANISYAVFCLKKKK